MGQADGTHSRQGRVGSKGHDVEEQKASKTRSSREGRDEGRAGSDKPQAQRSHGELHYAGSRGKEAA